VDKLYNGSQSLLIEVFFPTYSWSELLSKMSQSLLIEVFFPTKLPLPENLPVFIKSQSLLIEVFFPTIGSCDVRNFQFQSQSLLIEVFFPTRAIERRRSEIKSQSLLIEVFFPTIEGCDVRNFQFHVAIPSNWGLLSYFLRGGRRMFYYKSQSLLIEVFFPTGIFEALELAPLSRNPF